MSYCVLGQRGFLGGALTARLGDVTSNVTSDTRVIFHFASHVHPVFEQDPLAEMDYLLHSFSRLLEWASHREVLFVFPSSALVYEKLTQFAKFKRLLEDMAECYGAHYLALRIFPVYGPTESRTVISKWCRAMAEGKRPIVYGDGTQTRDFIYIDDVVEQILTLVDQCKWKSMVADIGAGVSTSFNDIVAAINAQLGTQIEPKYVNRPSSYSEGIICKNPMPTKVSIREGVRQILANVGSLQKVEALK